MRVDRPGVHQQVRGGLVHDPDQPPGRHFHDLDRVAARTTQPGPGWAAAPRPVQAAAAAPQHPPPDQGLRDVARAGGE